MKRQKSIVSAIISVLIIAMLIGALAIFSGAVAGNGIEVEGAQIRTEGVQGLRFVAKVDRAKFELTTGENANFGILLIPKSMIGADEEITVDTHTVKDVKAKNLMSQTEDYYEFTAVLLDIPAEFYGTELVARAYVKLDDEYIYSNQLTRSVKYVAEEILKDGKATDVDIAAANTVLKAYGEVGNDIVVNVDEIWNGPSVLTAYPEYPTQIARDYMYSVSVSQKAKTEELTVYNHVKEFFYQDRFVGGDVNRRFCEFAFSGAAVTVDVKVNTDFDTYAVVPTSKGFESTFSDGVISITMDEPEQLVVILDDDVNTALAIFADAPETDVPTKDSADVYVTGWNNYKINGNATMNDNGELTVTGVNCDIYVAPGAVFNARIVAPEADSSYKTKIYGRGIILDPYSNIYDYDPSAATTTSLIRLGGYTSTVKDVKLLDARCFNLNMDRGSGIVDNVKILSTEMTSDGITTTAEADYDEATGVYVDGVVKNCFVYCGDNALVSQIGNVATKGYLFENITIGTTCSAIYPQYTCNSTFNDIYVFRADEGLISIKHDSDEGGKKEVVINNLDALDCVRTPWLFFAEDQKSASKNITLNKVLMRYTTGSADASVAPGTSTNAKTMFKGSSAGSGYTFKITDLYVGGTLITKDSQVSTSSLTASKSYYSSGNTPAVLQGDSIVANHVYGRKLVIGNREVFLKSKPLYINGEWHLPYDEIASDFCVTPQNPSIQTVNGVRLISVSNLIASGAITEGSYDDTQKAIKLTAKVDPSKNILQDNEGVRCDYNRAYYKDKTEYLKAVNDNGVWVYTAKSAVKDSLTNTDRYSDNQGGIMRMILDEYKQYGAGTYKITFEYVASSSVTVAIGVNNSNTKYSKSVSSSSSFKTTSVEFTISENPNDVEQMAIYFKLSPEATISIKNITMVKS